MPSGVTMRGRKRCHSRPDGDAIHVVVVVVRHQHRVDLRQVVEGDAGRIHALGADERKGTGAIRPHRIDQNVSPARLQQEAGVADVGHAHRVAGDLRGRPVRGESDSGTLAGHDAPRSPNCQRRNASRPFGPA